MAFREMDEPYSLPAQKSVPRAVYGCSGAASVTTLTASTIVNFDTKVYDSGGYNGPLVQVGTNWSYLVDRDGVYSISLNFLSAVETSSFRQDAYILVTPAGSPQTTLNTAEIFFGQSDVSTTSNRSAVGGVGLLELHVGDRISASSLLSAGTTALSGDTTGNRIRICYVGPL